MPNFFSASLFSLLHIAEMINRCIKHWWSRIDSNKEKHFQLRRFFCKKKITRSTCKTNGTNGSFVTSGSCALKNLIDLLHSFGRVANPSAYFMTGVTQLTSNESVFRVRLSLMRITWDERIFNYCLQPKQRCNGAQWP